MPYQIGQHGQLQEWYEDRDKPDDKHRHVNHLIGLHPGSQISPITTPDLAKAAGVSLSQRGAMPTGWSLGWKMNMMARLRARGNLTVDLDWNSGKLTQLTIRSDTGNPCTLRYQDPVIQLHLSKGETLTLNRKLEPSPRR